MGQNKYHRITYSDRQMAEKLYKNGYTNPQVASVIGVHRTTMCSEFKRGFNAETGMYEADRAQQMIFSKEREDAEGK